MVEKIFTHKINVKRNFELLKTWNISPGVVKDVEKFFDDYSLGKVTKRIGTNNPASSERLLHSLKPALESLKGFEKKDLEKFLEDWIKDKIKKKDGRPYSDRCKKETLNILKRFVKWKGKDSSPLDLIMGSKERTPPSLTEEEIEELYKACNTPRERYFIGVLYSSGARAEEFHNIRFNDITMPTSNEKGNYIYVRLRGEFSKTHGRNIPLIWKHSLDAVRDYLSIRIEEGIKPEEAVFPVTYRGMRKWLQRFGKKVLKKPINYHLFRHTRATHLNKTFERHQMSVFFGWDFTSKMLDRYSNRDAVSFKVVEQKFDKTEREELEGHVEAQQKRIDELEKVIGDQAKEIRKVIKLFKNE